MIVQTYDPCVPTEFRNAFKLTFGAGGGVLKLFDFVSQQSRIEIIEVNLQPDAATILQINEGTIQGKIAVGSFFSGAWTLAGLQFWSEPGKEIFANLNLVSSAACNVSCEIRYLLKKTT